MDKETTIKEFLEFRSKFTKREWHELNQAIDLSLIHISEPTRPY